MELFSEFSKPSNKNLINIYNIPDGILINRNTHYYISSKGKYYKYNFPVIFISEVHSIESEDIKYRKDDIINFYHIKITADGIKDNFYYIFRDKYLYEYKIDSKIEYILKNKIYRNIEIDNKEKILYHKDKILITEGIINIYNCFNKINGKFIIFLTDEFYILQYKNIFIRKKCYNILEYKNYKIYTADGEESIFYIIILLLHFTNYMLFLDININLLEQSLIEIFFNEKYIFIKSIKYIIKNYNSETLLCKLFRRLDDKGKDILKKEFNFLNLKEALNIFIIIIYFPENIKILIQKAIKQEKEFLIEDLIYYYKKIDRKEYLIECTDILVEYKRLYLISLITEKIEENYNLIELEKIKIDMQRSLNEINYNIKYLN